jgi:hypothetical protein
VLHAQRSRERGVRFDDDVVVLTVLRQSGAGVEGMNFDLVDGGFDLGVALEKFLELSLAGGTAVSKRSDVLSQICPSFLLETQKLEYKKNLHVSPHNYSLLHS